jgi:phosphinothricin acetyltransferase
MEAESAAEKAIIRPATIQDLEHIRSIYNYYVLNSTATFDTDEQSQEARRQWFDDHQREGLPVIVAEVDGSVIGWGSLSYYHSRCAYRQSVEPSIYVDANFIGRGVGEKLLDGLLATSRDKQYHCLVVLVCSENRRSLKLLERYGFATIGTLREVGRKFDRWLDVTIAQRLLSNP